jgi:hypothetical protein
MSVFIMCSNTNVVEYVKCQKYFCVVDTIISVPNLAC